jgi:hypothetical protein
MAGGTLEFNGSFVSGALNAFFSDFSYVGSGPDDPWRQSRAMATSTCR